MRWDFLFSLYIYNDSVLTGEIKEDKSGAYLCEWKDGAAQQLFNNFRSAVNTTIDVKIIAG